MARVRDSERRAQLARRHARRGDPERYTGWWLRAVGAVAGDPDRSRRRALRRTCGKSKRLTRKQLRGLLRMNAERERRRHMGADAATIVR